MEDTRPVQPEAPQSSNDQSDVQKHKLVAAIGYISVLCLVPLFTARESKFAQFHGKQGLALFLVAIVVAIMQQIMPTLWPILALCNLGLLVLSVMGLIKAAEGQYWELPIFGELAKKLTF